MAAQSVQVVRDGKKGSEKWRSITPGLQRLQLVFLQLPAGRVGPIPHI